MLEYILWPLVTSGIKNTYSYQADKDLVLQAGIEKKLNAGSYEVRLVFEKYDSKGNVLQLRKVNDAPTSYLWGYSQAVPVAQAVNANWDQIYYEGFETHVSGIASPLSAHSGKKYAAVSFSIPFTPPAGTYELSYWKYESSAWSKVTQPYTGPATISAVRLDDIRIYPVGSQMTTYDYDPLIGTITATEANNNSTHYTYDEFQRLIQIKDLDNQLVKGFKYQYKN